MLRMHRRASSQFPSIQGKASLDGQGPSGAVRSQESMKGPPPLYQSPFTLSRLHHPGAPWTTRTRRPGLR